MPVLAYDTETTGFTNNREPPSHPSQLHLVQLAATLYSDDGERLLGALALIVRPEGYEIPKPASDVHGITTELALACGVPLIVACAAFSNLAKLATVSVAHNHDFDLKVLGAAFHRCGRPLPALNSHCTKNLAEAVVNLPPTERMKAAGFGHKPKAPTLGECYRFFFNETLEGAHDALVDARACARVYFELMRKGAVNN
jgi:DNA polymerase III subunit epsilon